MTVIPEINMPSRATSSMLVSTKLLKNKLGDIARDIEVVKDANEGSANQKAVKRLTSDIHKFHGLVGALETHLAGEARKFKGETKTGLKSLEDIFRAMRAKISPEAYASDAAQCLKAMEQVVNLRANMHELVPQFVPNEVPQAAELDDEQTSPDVTSSSSSSPELDPFAADDSPIVATPPRTASNIDTVNLAEDPFAEKNEVKDSDADNTPPFGAPPLPPDAEAVDKWLRHASQFRADLDTHLRRFEESCQKMDKIADKIETKEDGTRIQKARLLFQGKDALKEQGAKLHASAVAEHSHISTKLQEFYKVAHSCSELHNTHLDANELSQYSQSKLTHSKLASAIQDYTTYLTKFEQIVKEHAFDPADAKLIKS